MLATTNDTPTSSNEEAQSRLVELEQTAQELWIVEPKCDARCRTLLLTKLSAVSRRIDHLVLRQQFHPDEPIDMTELNRCGLHLGHLVTRWNRQRPTTALAA